MTWTSSSFGLVRSGGSAVAQFTPIELAFLTYGAPHGLQIAHNRALSPDCGKQVVYTDAIIRGALPRRRPSRLAYIEATAALPHSFRCED